MGVVCGFVGCLCVRWGMRWICGDCFDVVVVGLMWAGARVRGWCCVCCAVLIVMGQWDGVVAIYVGDALVYISRYIYIYGGVLLWVGVWVIGCVC